MDIVGINNTGTTQRNTTQCNAMQRNTTQCNAMQRNATYLGFPSLLGTRDVKGWCWCRERKPTVVWRCCGSVPSEYIHEMVKQFVEKRGYNESRDATQHNNTNATKHNATPRTERHARNATHGTPRTSTKRFHTCLQLSSKPENEDK
jgi:hypothetical protein